MPDSTRGDLWGQGEAYDSFMGRWSALVAAQFLDWLNQTPGLRWLDVGCGTGALSAEIIKRCRPFEVVGVDASPDFLERARATSDQKRQRFVVGNAQDLPLDADCFDAAVSGLVLNFVPRKEQALAELRRVVRRGGVVALYVWDYGGKMDFLRHFWDAAVALDPAASGMDEGTLFPICRPAPLIQLFHQSNYENVESRSIDVPTVFPRFEDYWRPFLGGQGPAGAYCASLTEAGRMNLRERLRESVPRETGGAVQMVARAWAVKGRVGT